MGLSRLEGRYTKRPMPWLFPTLYSARWTEEWRRAARTARIRLPFTGDNVNEPGKTDHQATPISRLAYEKLAVGLDDWIRGGRWCEEVRIWALPSSMSDSNVA